MNRIEQAKRKLNRLENEQIQAYTSAREEAKRIPFGQPNIIGRPDIYKNINRNYEKSFKLEEDIEKQKNRIEILEKIEDFKEQNELLKDIQVVGKSSWATVGAKTSVNNLEYFKNKLMELENANNKAKEYNKTKPIRKMETYGSKITKLKNKIAMLEKMKEKNEHQIISEKSQQLIDDEVVVQWKKKTIYYFVKGLRKVALELDEKGNFQYSRRYYPYSEDDKRYVDNLLNK